MTNAQKKKVFEEVERRLKSGEDKSQKVIAEWTFKELNLTFTPSQSTISTLRKKRINFQGAELNP